jgi:peptide/nickel transport system permease protein
LKKFIKKHPLGGLGLLVVVLFSFVAIYAPLLAASKPLFVQFDGEWYFPLFRYLFYQGYYTKPLDLFFNLMMFTVPLALVFRSTLSWMLLLSIQLFGFAFLMIQGIPDPAHDAVLTEERMKHLPIAKEDESKYLNAYGRLNAALKAKDSRIGIQVMPLLSHFHWEEDAAKDPKASAMLRINQKDMTAALIFGTRISLVVGLLSCGLALMIGIPIGAYAGYYGGRFDLVVCRLMEIWESMPAFFMLLFAVAILQSKSIFIVIALIAVFGWTGFSRYIRGECLKQRSLSYVEACKAIGFSNHSILFKQILPNAIPPVLTLLPFAIMGAISAEAGLSFLGLGEEGSTSWGVLMDEGRSAFPARAYLLWPPAIALTVLLVAIALVGDALRDFLDPKMD